MWTSGDECVAYLQCKLQCVIGECECSTEHIKLTFLCVTFTHDAANKQRNVAMTTNRREKKKNHYFEYISRTL